MDPITERAVPVRSDDVVHFPSGDQTFLHHLSSGEYFALNAVGSEVWDLCDGQLDIAGIAERLTHAFVVERDEVLPDVLELVASMYTEDCVEIR